jgi:uncharacterized protein
MSHFEGIRHTEVAPPTIVATEATARVLLVWDAPNLDMGLDSKIGGRPTAAHRTRFDAPGRWLPQRTAELSAERPGTILEPEATVFTKIAPGSADVVRPWVEALHNVGLAILAKPKIEQDSDGDSDSDSDSDMLSHIALRRSEGLAGALVASGGVPVQVPGFREHAGWALTSDTLKSVDLEDVPGAFREPLPRIGLDSLPEQGAWLESFRPLSSLRTSGG